MSFSYPIFLWGIGLILVPLWLHLSRRRRFKQIRVGTLRFLKKMQVPRQRIARIEEWLLLLFRVLAILLLSLLFSRPVIPGTKLPDEQVGQMIVLMDASGSMTEAMAEDAILEAKSAVRKMTGSSKQKVTVAQFSDGVQVMEKIEDLSPIGGAPTNLTDALNWALDRLLNTGNGGSGRVVVIGHFAQNALIQPFDRVWPGTIDIEFIAVEPESDANAYISGIELLTPYQSDEMELEATVHVPEGKSETVYLESDGNRIEQTAEAGANRLRFRFRPPRESVEGWIALEEASDPWPADDRRPFSFRWIERIRILLVDGDPGATPFDGESYFLRKALEASGAAHGLSLFKADIAYGLSTRQGLLDLEPFQTIALCDVHSLTESEVVHLASYVEGGGGLVYFLGDRWDRAAYQRLSDAGLFPRNVDRVNGKVSQHLSAWNTVHPAFAPFDEEALRGLGWAERVEIKPSEGWTTIAALETGTAIMAEKGSIIVCAHPMNREWSDIPRSPVFVPLIKGMFSALSNVEEPAPPSREVFPGMHEEREFGWYPMREGSVDLVVSSSEESSLETESIESVRAFFGQGGDLKRERGRATTEKSTAGVSGMVEMWPWIALLLLGWIVVEGILATAPLAASGDPRIKNISGPISESRSHEAG